jgi:Holliday junction resolvase RusA-like endonuclease
VDQRRTGLDLYIPIIPRGWEAPQITRNGNFSPKTYSDYRKSLKAELQVAAYELQGRVELPFAGEVHMAAMFLLPQKLATNKPDLSNLIKALEDCMQGYIIKDDKQITKYLEPTLKRTTDSAEEDPGIVLSLIFIEPA